MSKACIWEYISLFWLRILFMWNDRACLSIWIWFRFNSSQIISMLSMTLSAQRLNHKWETQWHHTLMTFLPELAQWHHAYIITPSLALSHVHPASPAPPPLPRCLLWRHCAPLRPPVPIVTSLVGILWSPDGGHVTTTQSIIYIFKMILALKIQTI